MDNYNVRKTLVQHFQANPFQQFYTANLRRILNIPRKVLNFHLYALKRKGIIKKINDSPPVWCLDQITMPMVREYLEEGNEAQATTSAAFGNGSHGGGGKTTVDTKSLGIVTTAGVTYYIPAIVSNDPGVQSSTVDSTDKVEMKHDTN